MQEKVQNKEQGSWGEVFGTFIWALIIAMIFRSFLFQPFHIPSGSMKPTLMIGDYLVVSKYSYGYSKNSFPFSPDVFEGRMWYTEPKRGDIIVFKVPSRAVDNVLIKRIIGLPGDEIQMKDDFLYINGKKVDVVPDGEFTDPDKHADIRKYIETLPNGVKHEILVEGKSFVANTDVYKVPQGYFFMMGDNRDNSLDSRFSVAQGGPGFVAQEDLIGRAEVILAASGGSWNPSQWAFDRWFTPLRKFGF